MRKRQRHFTVECFMVCIFTVRLRTHTDSNKNQQHQNQTNRNEIEKKILKILHPLIKLRITLCYICFSFHIFPLLTRSLNIVYIDKILEMVISSSFRFFSHSSSHYKTLCLLVLDYWIEHTFMSAWIEAHCRRHCTRSTFVMIK